MRTFLVLIFISVLIIASTSLAVASNSLTSEQTTDQKTSKVILMSDIEWRPLNPARGKKGPKVGPLWGDNTGSGPSGFLVKFVDGFSSPPHIHNISYRAVVINGLIHNDDPNAAEMWMPKGSFWTQPKGEAHITSAKGTKNMVYVEIDEGPYLVLPTKKAFDSGERPVNLDPSNIVWIDHPKMPTSAKGPKIAFLWGDPQDDHFNGTLVKFSAGYSGKIRSQGTTFRAVVIQGQLQYQVLGGTNVETLVSGSYLGSKGESVHHISCESETNCTIYVRTKGKFDIIADL